MTGNGTVEVRFSLPPEMAVLFFLLLSLKDDGNFWKEFSDACVAQSAYLAQTGVREHGDMIVRLKDVSRLIEGVVP